MDTSGFYKQTQEGWLYAPNAINAPTYTLERDGNRQPIDGWIWHDKAPAEYIMWQYEQNNNIKDNEK